MMVTISTCESRRKSGQAMIESAIGLTVFVFMVTALVSFATLYLEGTDMLIMSRADVGTNALRAFGGESGGGNGFAISTHTHPDINDYRVPSSSSKYDDPWTYPVERFSEKLSFENWRHDSVRPLDVIKSGNTRNFEINLSLFGSNLFTQNGIHLKEEIYFPPVGCLP